jgi:hypothetical protein
MAKISRRFFGFFLIMMCFSISLLFAAESSQSAVPSAPSETTSGMDSALRAAQEEIRDPFAIAPETEAAVIADPSSVAARPEVLAILQGIGFGSKDAYAVIGGDVYYIGDEKNGIKLLEVRRREVDILANGGRITVPLFEGPELKKARERAKKKVAVENAPAEPSSEMPPSLPEKEHLPL